MANNLMLVYVGLLVLIGVRTGSALHCYQCDGLCARGLQVICDEAAANITVKYLTNYFEHLTEPKSRNNFQCVHIEFPENPTQTKEFVRGCIYKEVNPCGHKLKANITRGECKTCTKNLCNPAARATINGFYTVLTLMVAKFLSN